MAYDEKLADRLRPLLGDGRDVQEKLMFGGLTFMVGGHMCCGVTARDFVFRVGPERYDLALEQPHARPCDFTGKPLKGMVSVSPDAASRPDGLDQWVAWSTAFVTSLPAR